MGNGKADNHRILILTAVENEAPAQVLTVDDTILRPTLTAKGDSPAAEINSAVPRAGVYTICHYNDIAIHCRVYRQLKCRILGWYQQVFSRNMNDHACPNCLRTVLSIGIKNSQFAIIFAPCQSGYVHAERDFIKLSG
ncbi:hypothetical protein ES703_98572 [subsurface metagenome]